MARKTEDSVTTNDEWLNLAGMDDEKDDEWMALERDTAQNRTLPPQPLQTQSTGPKLNAGSYIGIIAVIMIIIGILLPWYYIDISSDMEYYNTGGRKEFIRVGGIKSFEFNVPKNTLPQSNGSEEQNITDSRSVYDRCKNTQCDRWTV